MYLSRIEPRPDADPVLVGAKLATIYGLHQLVWSWFSESSHQQRDFLYRQEGSGRTAKIYTLSSRPPRDPSGLWSAEIKPFKPVLRQGDRLAFTLRANAVKRAIQGEGAGRRHDVVMAAKRETSPGGLPAFDADIVQEQGTAWLNRKLNRIGATIADSEVRVDGYQQHRLTKPREGSPVRFSSLDFSGYLKVTDPEGFLEGISAGIGPAKSFGFGLMMLRRA